MGEDPDIVGQCMVRITHGVIHRHRLNMHDCNEIYVYHKYVYIYIYIYIYKAKAITLTVLNSSDPFPRHLREQHHAPRINTPPRSAESPLAPFPRTALVGCGPPRNGENQQTPSLCCKGCCTSFFCC